MKTKPENILLIDKPKGISSYDVIRRLKKTYPKEKLGHAGTLDPLASGLMLVGVGRGTKTLHDLAGLSKEYVVEVLLGTKTDTADMEGQVVESKKVERLKVESGKVEKILGELAGKLVLPVPKYSAVKQGGEPLYKKVRRGEEVLPPERKMEILGIELLDAFSYEDGYVLNLRMEVSSGTYVRSIAEEIGDRLGVPATVKELRRTKVGEFRVEDAEQLPVRQKKKEGNTPSS